ncbi:spore gernimation protein [Brevibacillus fluminis]|uniref:Spore gernimation protein n=1 Tax=Brevibacillus fluminis TaxID=511487 RepID=A0A3M8DBL8_9BACL|nr:GerAB/ArcD/ProY family transporter [Brevibacillus fluminis]RNB84705.1 spore gernimation protein [Brevibacillus fluminis]
MEINVYPKKSNQLPSYLLAILVHSNQVGMGVLGFQRFVAKEAGHDAWISLIVAGIAAHLIMWIIMRTLSLYPSSDLYGINCDVFGTWIGNVLNLLYMTYFTMITMAILRSYIEVLQTWMFPKVSTWSFALVILGLALYTIFGGIRIITGFTFISLVFTVWVILDMYFPLQYARWSYLYPVLEAKLPQILNGSIAMSFTMVGFEISYVLYPFLREKQRASVSAQLGMLYTNLIYLCIMIVTLTFFSKKQLMQAVWPTLNLQQMVYMPFLERFEYIIIPIWLLIILPNIMLYTWCVSRGFKRMFNWPAKKTTTLVLVTIFIASQFFLTRTHINAMVDFASRVGLYVVFAYPPFLYVMASLKAMWRKKRSGGHEHESST